MNTESIYQSLLSNIGEMPVIDTHEHLPWDAKYRKTDILNEYLSSYINSDLISAGMSHESIEKVINPDIDILERWRIAEPYWEACRYTGYGRALDTAVKGIYGIDGLNRYTIEKANAIFKENVKPGHTEKVLRDLCKIETSMICVYPYLFDGENGIFKRVWELDEFIIPGEDFANLPLAYCKGVEFITYIEQKYRIYIKHLDDWLEAMERELDHFLDQYGVRVIKIAIAYQRTLRFNKVEYSDAKSYFETAMNRRNNAINEEDRVLIFNQELQDFMMHYALKLANKRHLTIQVHTGLFEGRGDDITRSDPSLMINLFSEYPDVNFDIFHIGYPYQAVLSALGKMFPNVFIDMCWAHIISPSASIHALGDFLDAIPYNKISAFGGDYGFVDGIYGHLMISRQNISRTLALKVESGVYDVDTALVIAKALYYDNPKRILQL